MKTRSTFLFFTLFVLLALGSNSYAAELSIYATGHISGDYTISETKQNIKFASNSSKIGARGSHAINSDMAIFAQFETGFDLSGEGKDDGNSGIDMNSGLFTITDSFLGITSKAGGTIYAGRLPVKNYWINDYNLFTDQVGDFSNIVAVASLGEDRMNSAVGYATPSFEGIDMMLIYAGKGIGSGKGDTYFGKVNYDSKKGFKTSGYYIYIDDDNKSTKNPNQFGISSSISSNNNSAGVGFSMIFNGRADKDDKKYIWYIGASVDLSGGFVLKGHYADLIDDQKSQGARMYALGIDYKMAEQAILYFTFGHIFNGADAYFIPNGWGHGNSGVTGGKPGDDIMALSIGFVYKFKYTVLSDR